MSDPLQSWTTDPDQLAQEMVRAQKMEALGRHVSGVAHELNNPLAAIIAFSQLIGRDPRLPDDLRHDADLLVQEAQRTRRIIENLLDFVSQRPPERHPTPLATLVASVLDLQTYLISTAQVKVEVDIPNDLALIADRAQMQQVLLNLTLNAIQAIGTRGGGGHLWIRAWSDRDAGTERVRLEVTDDGPGVQEEQRTRLFEPFFTTKEPGEGTGLGLAVSLELVARHGGRLQFEPAAGGGATFVLDLPAAVQPEGRPDSEDPAPVAAGLVEAKDARPRVLVIDDEPAIRRFLLKALAIAGAEAVLAEDGATAVDLLRREDFDAVMCDHRMTGMSGADVYEAVAALRPELARRFVFMTGDVLNAELRGFAETRGVRLLAKPFDLASVGGTLRALLVSDTVQDLG